jgi:hypothetical protein
MKTSQSLILFALFSILLLNSVADTLSAQDEETRCYYMGFTPFPWDTTVDAIIDTAQFIMENGDIISQHLEQGVPWTEALDDNSFHPNMMKDWQGRKDISKNKKIFLSLTPLNEGRNAMEMYRGKDEDMPIPKLFKDKAFSDPIIKKAYLNYCRRAVKFFQPDYLAIGIEVNELFHNSPKLWTPFVELYKDTYTELKRDNPNLPIFFTVSLHNLTNPGWKDREKQQDEIKKLLEYADILGISYYPFMAGQSEEPTKTLDWIRKFTDKPLAITETGFPAEDIVLKTYKMTISGSPEKQATHFRTLLKQGNQDDYLFVIAFLYRDYDALFKSIAPQLEKRALTLDIFSVWKDCGMVDENGVKRPSYDIWTSYFNRKVEDVKTNN